MLLYILMYIAFLLYHIALFEFSEKLYVNKPNRIISRLITFLINSVILFFCYYFRPHDSIIMIVFVLAIYIECIFFYKEKVFKNIFIAISFGINLFAVRLLIKCVLALVTDLHLSQITDNMQMDMLSTTMALAVCSIYIKIVLFKISEKNANIMRSNKENLFLVSVSISLIYAFLVFNTTNLYIQENYSMFLAIQIKIALSAIIGYFAALVYGFMHSKGMLFKTQSYEMHDKIAIQDKENQRLRYIAYRDESVECYNRAFAMDSLDKALSQNESTLSVVYIDLDGLKNVNDKFGHSEGDIYIKNIANILNNTFDRFNVCRMGGDEFMIIMHNCDEYTAQKHCLQAYEAVTMLCDMNKHKYMMSISYGILEINHKQKYTISDVLEIVDKRMYEFKRANKGARSH